MATDGASKPAGPAALILWDVDGTLLHCGRDGTVALNRTFQKRYGILDAFSGVGIGRAMDAVLLDRIIEKNDIDRGDRALIQELFLKELQDVLAQDEKKRILPGVEDLLSSCAARGVINSLLTSNLRQGAEAKLRALGLFCDAEGNARFIGGGFGDRAEEKWDAALRAWKDIIRQTGWAIPAERVLVVGDGLYDIQTARHCGFRSLAVATGWTPRRDLAEAGPDLLVDTLAEIDCDRLFHRFFLSR